MEKGSSVTRFILIAVAMFLAWQYLPKLFGAGGHDGELQPIGPGRTETNISIAGKEAPAKCRIEGKRFEAELSSRGAALVDFYITGDPRYVVDGKPVELMTVPGEAPNRFDLLFDWRSMGVTGESAQVPFDVADWTIAEHDASSCTFKFANDKVALTKTFRAGQGPFELLVSGTIENLADGKRTHRLGIENT